MLCCPRYQWERKIPSSHYCLLPILIYWWTIATIMMIIIPQISQTMDHYMPLLGDYRRYTDLTYTLLSPISIEKRNTI